MPPRFPAGWYTEGGTHTIHSFAPIIHTSRILHFKRWRPAGGRRPADESAEHPPPAGVQFAYS